MSTLTKDYSAKDLQEISVGYSEEEQYTCLAKVTDIYKGMCDDLHWEKCVIYNERKADEEFDKYLTRDYLSETDSYIF